MVIKKKEGVLGEGEIKPFTKEELEAWKWPIRIFLILAISVFIGWSVYTTPGLMNSIFAKTATDASVVKPPSGVENPLVIGTATPTQNGQETTAAYVPKYNPNGPDNPTGTTVQEVALNDLPEKLVVTRGGSVYMINLKIKDNYLYGDLVSTIDISKDTRVAFLDKNGKQIIEAGISGLLYGGYEAGNVNNLGKKLNIYVEYPIGAIKLKKGEERYFRVLLPPGAMFIQIFSGL